MQVRTFYATEGRDFETVTVRGPLMDEWLKEIGQEASNEDKFYVHLDTAVRFSDLSDLFGFANETIQDIHRRGGTFQDYDITRIDIEGFRFADRYYPLAEAEEIFAAEYQRPNYYSAEEYNRQILAWDEYQALRQSLQGERLPTPGRPYNEEARRVLDAFSQQEVVTRRLNANPRGWGHEVREQAVRMFENEGLSRAEIARQLGPAVSTVSKWLREEVVAREKFDEELERFKEERQGEIR